MADIMSIVFTEMFKGSRPDNAETVCKTTIATTESNQATTPTTTDKTSVADNSQTQPTDDVWCPIDKI